MSICVVKMKQSCEEVSALLKALSHPQRLMVLGHLLEGPKSVSELIHLCSTSQSQMSQFLRRMSMEGLVKVERRGKFRVYSVADRRLNRLLKVIQAEYC